MLERETIKQCIDRLNEFTEINAIEETVQPAQNLQYRWDTIVAIDFANKRQLYGVELKYGFTTTTAIHTVTMIEAQFGRQEETQRHNITPLVCADYINDRAAYELRQHNMNYIDAVGNAYLTHPKGLYVFVEGKRRQIDRAQRKGRLYQPTGLKIIINLLIDPGLIDMTQRIIGYEAGVALGTVAWVIRDLREEGYLKQTGPNQVKIIRKKELFEKWVEGYAEKLRPKQYLGQYATFNKDIETVAKYAALTLHRKNVRWAITGDYAENILINYYETGRLVILVEKWNEDLVKELEWIPARDGIITVLKGFGLGIFDGPEKVGLKLAQAPLIYAELVEDGNDRAKDAAARIYDRFIKDTIEDE